MYHYHCTACQPDGHDNGFEKERVLSLVSLSDRPQICNECEVKNDNEKVASPSSLIGKQKICNTCKAAPDLLAIVAELARYDGLSGSLPELIVQARAAIAKATTTTQEE